MDEDVKVAARSAMRPGLTLAGETDSHAVLDTGGNLDIERAGLAHPSRAVTLGAGRGDILALSAALWAGLADAEHAIAASDDAVAVTLRAGFQRSAGFSPIAVAALAGHRRGDAHGFGLAGKGIRQADLEIEAQVGSPRRSLASAATAAAHAAGAEHVAEHLLENIGEVCGMAAAERTLSAAATHAALEGGMAHAVIGCALLAVGQHRIGLSDFLEFCFGLGVARIAVRVILHGELAIGAFQRLVVHALFDAQNFVIVAFGGHELP